MATVTGTGVYDNKRVFTYTWNNLVNGSVGSACDLGAVGNGAIVPSIQFFGTFGTGGNIAWDTSNDGNTWFTVSATNAAANQFQLQGIGRFIRPRITAGDGTTNLTASVQMAHPY